MRKRLAAIRHAVTKREEDDTSIDGMFVKLSIAKPSIYDLELVNWEDELIKSVLGDVDEEVELLPVGANTIASWMDVSTATNLFMGNYEKLGLQVGNRQQPSQEQEDDVWLCRVEIPGVLRSEMGLERASQAI
jgi:hypothetical protein